MQFSIKNYFSFTSHAAFGSGLRAWIRLLKENNFAIHPFFIPKSIFISCAIFLGLPFRWYERNKLRKILPHQVIKAPVFIIGHPRSGTTFLHYLMSKDQQFGYCSTIQAMLPHVFLTGASWLIPGISKALPKKRPMDNLKMGSQLPKEEDFAISAFSPESMISSFYFPRNYTKNFLKNVTFKNQNKKAERWKVNFDYLLRKLLFANQGKTLLLKSPANTARVKQILELYPDAKFIHIHRNPYEVYSSTLHLLKKILPLLSFQKVKMNTLEESTFECYEALYKKYFNEKTLIPKGNLVEIDYAVFIKNPLLSLQKIYDHLNLKDFNTAVKSIEEELNEYKNYETNRFVLDEKTRLKIATRWKFAFDELGYTT